MTAENLATGLQATAESRFRRSVDVPQAFFNEEAEQIARACLEMARRFLKGGRLLAFGAGNAATDAQHVSVEFVHPVIVGKRALPAIALGTDLAATQGVAAQEGQAQIYAAQLQVLGRPVDIAMGIDPGGGDESVREGLVAAADLGMLAIGLSGGDPERPRGEKLDFKFHVPDSDPDVVQETHETLYHILWELVHVFFEHRVIDEDG